MVIGSIIDRLLDRMNVGIALSGELVLCVSLRF